jgi:uncharacterized protein YjeT (DUF2065 family)
MDLVTMRKRIALAIALVFLVASCIILTEPVSASLLAENSWAEKAPMNQARAGVAAAVAGVVVALATVGLLY